MLGLGTFTEGGVTSFTSGSQVTIADTVLLGGPTVRLNGVTSWSAGRVQILDAGGLENAGVLRVTGSVGVDVYSGSGVPGVRVLRVLVGGVVEVSGVLAVGSELESDGTLRALAGGWWCSRGRLARRRRVGVCLRRLVAGCCR